MQARYFSKLLEENARSGYICGNVYICTSHTHISQKHTHTHTHTYTHTHTRTHPKQKKKTQKEESRRHTKNKEKEKDTTTTTKRKRTERVKWVVIMPSSPPSSPYCDTVCVNQVPYFDWTSMDTVRIGSFMAVQLREQDDPQAITIARLEERLVDEEQDPDFAATSIRLRLFLPLFPVKRLSWHPSPPSHNYTKIVHGCGSRNEEVYESSELRWISGEKPDSEIKILFPTYVFTLEELSKRENRWAEGMHNVYFVRFWKHVIYSYVEKTKRRLEPLPAKVSMNFVNKHPDCQRYGNLIMPRRCMHQNIWMGLYKLRKFVLKIGRKRGDSRSLESELSWTVGCIPQECIQYIYSLANFLSHFSSHPVTLRDSFQKTGLVLFKPRIKLSYQAGVLKFETLQDMLFVISLFGEQVSHGHGSAQEGTDNIRKRLYETIDGKERNENTEN